MPREHRGAALAARAEPSQACTNLISAAYRQKLDFWDEPVYHRPVNEKTSVRDAGLGLEISVTGSITPC